MQRIIYLSLMNDDKYKSEKRYAPLSGMLKMKGVYTALSECGYDVLVVSASPSHGKSFCKGHEKQIAESVWLKLFASFGRRNIILKIIDYLFIHLQIMLFFLIKVKKNDKVIVYHSLYYDKLVCFLKKIKGFHLILEMEELYADVNNIEKQKRRELHLAKMADAFILPTELLKESIGIGKKCVIIHGTYLIEKQNYAVKKDKNIVKIVYAGTLDPRKGCLEVIQTAQHLPSNYHIYVLGSGTENDISLVENEISRINLMGNACISYEGVKVGKEYNAFLQSCDIGLCVQDPNASFTNTSFPSKVLSYLSNGLRVVCVDIPALTKSDISDVLFFCKNNEPYNIAKTILEINLDNEYDSRMILMELYLKSKTELDKMLRSL